MKVLKRLLITVNEPFSGGKLKIFDGAKRVFPNIYLAPLTEPSYEGVLRSVAAYDQLHRKKDRYTIEYTEQDLPYITFENLLHWELEGEPRESVNVEPTMHEI